MWLALLALAAADPGTLPAGSSTLYAGGGLSVWRFGMSDNRRDPSGIARIDTWAGHGLSDRVMISGSVPLVHGRVLQDAAPYGPCPAPTDTCDAITSVGDAHALVHVGLPWRALRGRLALGPRSDAWNAGTRTRYINVGQGTWGGIVEGSLGAERGPIGAFVEGRYLLRFGRPVPGLAFRAPSDAVQGSAVAHGRWRGLRLAVGAHAHQQLAGVPFDAAYLREYWPTDERWGVIRFAQLRAEAKLSVALSDHTGLHLAGSRAVLTANGPPDHWDASVGAHLWLPRRER